VLPAVELAPHANAPYSVSGHPRVFTGRVELPASADEVAALESHALKSLRRPSKPSEPPAYSWVVMGGRLQEHWARDAAVGRLLMLVASLAAQAAALLGLQLGAHEFTILNVWEPGCRAEASHDDEKDRLTVLLRLRSVALSGELQFESSTDCWHTALGDGQNVLIMAPEVLHRVTQSRGGDRSRLTVVTLYRTCPVEP
jgi:hypothetical protein